MTSKKGFTEWIETHRLRHITVYALAAYVGKIERFRSPKKLVAYIGLQPRLMQSGEKSISGSLTGGGQRDLRSLLIEAAHCVFRYPQQKLTNV